jgi:biotin carboxyl carrier protein
MPGKIVDVLIEVGDTVEVGEGVLILEAMKMENELRAHKKGTVTSVLVKRGDSVERGQLLVALE